MPDNKNQPSQQKGKQSFPQKKGERDAEIEGLEIATDDLNDDDDDNEITQRNPRMGDPQRPTGGDRKP